MKKVVITVAALIGILWGYNAYNAGRASGKLTYQAGSFKFDKISTTGITAHGTMDVLNPTNTAITINGLMGEVYLNNSLLANFNNQKNVTIAANGRTTVQYDVSSFSTTVLMALVAAISSGRNQSVSIRGTINYGLFQVPFTITYKLQDIIKGMDPAALVQSILGFVDYYNKIRNQ